MVFLIRFLKSIVCIINPINEWIGRVVSWLTLVMVLITFTIVILRYVFNIGWIAVQESITYMHTLVFMLGAAYTLKYNGHVRVDIFYQQCSTKTKAWIDLFGTLLLLMPVAFFILWSSWEYVGNSWNIYESSASSGGLPGVFLIKTLIPVMAVLLLLQSISIAIQSLFIGLGINIDEVAE